MRESVRDQRVGLVGDDDPAVAPEVFVGQVGQIAVRDDHRVDRAQAVGGIVDDGRVVQHEAEAHAGSGARRDPRHRRPDRGEAVVRPVDRELTRRFVGRPGRLALEHAPRGIQRDRRVLGEAQSQRRELVRIAPPGEDRVVEVIAQPRERRAQRRLAQVQPLGGARHAALGQQCVQRDQQIEVETGQKRVIGHGDVILRPTSGVPPILSSRSIPAAPIIRRSDAA